MAGHYRRKAGQLDTSTKVRSLFLKISWQQEISTFSSYVICSLDPAFYNKPAPGLGKQILKTSIKKKLPCLSIDWHLTEDNLGVKMLSSKSDLQMTGQMHFRTHLDISAVLKQEGFPLQGLHLLHGQHLGQITLVCV